MNWDNLDDVEKGFYSWFQRRGCGRFARSKCPIIDKQLDGNGFAQSKYLPETVCGEPRCADGSPKEVSFLALNPGGRAESEEGEAGFELAEYDGPNGLVDYANAQLRWFTHPVGAQLDDGIVGSALWLMLRAHGEDLPAGEPMVGFGSTQFTRAHDLGLVGSLVILNMAHCKSSGYPNDRQEEHWSECGAQTFRMLKHWMPKVCVVMGGPQWYWLQYQHANREVADAWQIDNFAPDWGNHSTIAWHGVDGPSTRLISVYHYSAYNPGVAVRRAAAEAAAADIGQFLGWF
jgi:hypothetical protein